MELSLGSQLSTANIYLHMLAGWDPAIYVPVLMVFAQPGKISAQQFSNVKKQRGNAQAPRHRQDFCRQPLLVRQEG